MSDARNEYVEGRLLDDIERTEWAAQRDGDLAIERQTVTRESMIARLAADRALVEAAWAGARPSDLEYGRLRWAAELAIANQEAKENAA